MSEPNPRFWEIFFEVYEALPRQGPGNRACAEKALGLCRDLSPTPAALDVLDQLAQEPETHRRYSDYYAYEFFVTRRDG